MRRRPPPWNHNIHYYPLILSALPAAPARVLDVGCGEGMLARELSRRGARVCAIDLDAAIIEMARRRDTAGGVEFVQGDFLAYPFAPGSFDMISSVAALHHMDAAAALERMKRLLRPGGTLAIVGLARSRLPADLPWDAAAFVANLGHRLTKTYWPQPAPIVWPPPDTYAGMRRLAARVLPGSRYRRHLLWRYSVVWAKPAV